MSGLKALMLKLRALEQNQSVLEQYVENLGRSYAEGLTDLDSEIASLHSHVGRLSQASDSLTATLRQAEDKRQSEMLALQHGMRSRSHQLEVHIQLLRYAMHSSAGGLATTQWGRPREGPVSKGQERGQEVAEA